MRSRVSIAAFQTSSLTLRTLHVPLHSRATGKAAFCTCQAGHGKSFKQCQCTGSFFHSGHGASDLSRAHTRATLCNEPSNPRHKCFSNHHDRVFGTHLPAPPASRQRRLQTVNEKSWLLATTVHLLLGLGPRRYKHIENSKHPKTKPSTTAELQQMLCNGISLAIHLCC